MFNARMIFRALFLSIWYSLFASVWLGQTTMESPVCTPTGSTIFHVTDHDRSIVCVAHHLIFDLFIALHAFFHEYLMDRGKLKRFFHHVVKLRFVVDKSAARAAERESGAQYDRIAYLFAAAALPSSTLCAVIGRTYRLAYTLRKAF